MLCLVQDLLLLTFSALAKVAFISQGLSFLSPLELEVVLPAHYKHAQQNIPRSTYLIIICYGHPLISRSVNTTATPIASPHDTGGCRAHTLDIREP